MQGAALCPDLPLSSGRLSRFSGEGDWGVSLETLLGSLDHRCPFWVWVEIDGFHWFNLVFFHLPGKPVYFSPRAPLFFFRESQLLGQSADGRDNCL